jgi:hypothetical protein
VVARLQRFAGDALTSQLSAGAHSIAQRCMTPLSSGPSMDEGMRVPIQELHQVPSTFWVLSSK